MRSLGWLRAELSLDGLIPLCEIREYVRDCMEKTDKEEGESFADDLDAVRRRSNYPRIRLISFRRSLRTTFGGDPRVR